MKYIIVIFFAACLGVCAGCSNEPADPEELIQVEQAFSEMSVQEGMKAAFLHFSHDSSVLLRPNSMPIIGKEALAGTFAGTDDSLFQLSWEPRDACIATSGELGYTYGVYRMTFQGDSIPETRGTYVTIWKKNAAGEWRFLLDTGQQGLGNEPR